MTVPEKAISEGTKALHQYDLKEGLSGYLVPSDHHAAEAKAALEAGAKYIEAKAIREFKARLEAGFAQDEEELEMMVPGCTELLLGIIDLCDLVATDIEEGS